MDRVKRYFKNNDAKIDATHIKLSVGYDLGGYNYYNGATNRRGYYLYVTPVRLSESEYNGRKYTTESITMFDGFKIFLNEVTRQSKKAENQALTLAFDTVNLDIIKRKYPMFDYSLED